MIRRAFLIAAVATAALGPVPAASAAPKTVLAYSIREARAFAIQLHYPQQTFISEKYDPCTPEDTPYRCDRNAYDHKPNCPPDAALGRTKEAPESPKPADTEGGTIGDRGGEDAVPSSAPDLVRGNPVTVTQALAAGRLSSTPEAGGLASLYYVDASGRRETAAHTESDAFVENRSSYEERCAEVNDGESEGDIKPIKAHMLSRASRSLQSYNVAAFTTAEAAYPPGGAKEAVSIVKLWQAGNRVNGLLSSTVRGVRLADGALTVDAVRTVVYFSSDGTAKGLLARAKTSAAGVRQNGVEVGSLPQGELLTGDGYVAGVLAPRIKLDGTRLTVVAGGLYVAAATPQLSQIAIPPELGGRLISNQVVYVAGVLVDAGLNRVQAFGFSPTLDRPILPPPPGGPPSIGGPSIPEIGAPPTTTPLPGVTPRFAVRAIDGSVWAPLGLLIVGALGLFIIAARWSMRWPWARQASRKPPFSGIAWAWRAFLQD